MLPASTYSSTTTLTSPLTSFPSQAARPKDYEAAFGTLSAAYGFGPGAFMPTPPPATPTSKRSSSHTTTEGHVTAPTRTQKDYNAAFGSLVSSYGLGDAQPSRSSTSK